jgi:hypothetical protein
MMRGADKLARDEQRAINEAKRAEKRARLMARLTTPLTASDIARDFNMSAGGALRMLKQMWRAGGLASRQANAYTRYFVVASNAHKLDEVCR